MTYLPVSLFDGPRPPESSPDAEIGGHDRDRTSAERARGRAEVRGRDTDVPPLAREDVLPMRRARHPLVDGARAARVGRLPAYVLPDRPVAAARGVVVLDPLPERRAVERLVLEVAHLAHLAGVGVRGCGQASGDLERPQSALAALGVDAPDDVELERAQATRRARRSGRPRRAPGKESRCVCALLLQDREPDADAEER